jgi:peptide/nickel transport system permease protein
MATISITEPIASRSRLRTALRFDFRLVVGGALALLFLLTAVAAPLLAPADPFEVNLVQRLKPPGWEASGLPQHLLGTDQLGRDLLSRVIYGARVSLLVGVSAVLVAALLGLPLGVVGGYFGGYTDLVIQRLIEIQMGLPFVLVAIILTVLFRPGLLSLIVVLGITGWVQYGRLSRVEVMSIKEREFMIAARMIGCSDFRMIARHILPNLAPTLMIIASIQLAQFILAEASLSFLGLGILPPTPSWGGMVNEGREFVWKAWWIQTFPGIAIVLTVTGIGLMGDWLRDRLDPRLRI